VGPPVGVLAQCYTPVVSFIPIVEDSTYTLTLPYNGSLTTEVTGSTVLHPLPLVLSAR